MIKLRTKNYFKEDIAPNEFVNYTMERIFEDTNNKPHMSITFDNIRDVIKCVDTNNFDLKCWHNIGIDDNDCFDTSINWFSNWTFGSLTLDETREACMSGMLPPEIQERVQVVRDRIAIEYPELIDIQNLAYKTRKRRKFSEDGGELDIDRYMCGDPDMWQSVQNIKDKRTIKMLFNSSLNAGADSDQFIEDMVICCMFIEICQTIGFAVEFWYAPISKDVTSAIWQDIMLVKLKDAEHAVDEQSIISAGLPGFFRYYVMKTESNVFPGIVDPYCGKAKAYTPDWIMQYFGFDVAVDATGSTTGKVKLLIGKIKSLLV